jgi:hypothetical protein
LCVVTLKLFFTTKARRHLQCGKEETLPVNNPDQPEPKRLLFTAEHAENAEMFFAFVIKFILRDLCGEKKYFARMWQDFTTR